MSLPKTTAGKVHYITELMEYDFFLPLYKKIWYRIKYGKDWKSWIFVKLLEDME
jgi:hypothetical protein